MNPSRRLISCLTVCAALGLAAPASALNGFLAGKTDPDLKTHTTQVVVMKKGEMTAVSVMPDYQGPIEPFAIVLLVPGDVTAARVTTLKREFVDRVDTVSAPRFHEFWEQDPCDPGPPQQEWERSLKVEGGGFLGGGSISGGKKTAKELFLDTEAKTKEGEYRFTVLEPGGDVVGWLGKKGYKAPANAAATVKPYFVQGYRAVIAEVDPKRIELIGGDRAVLSPIRFVTEQPFDTIPVKPGQLNSPGKQELLVYVLSDGRYEVKNYQNQFAPTNVAVDFVVKERMGEFYTALHDIILAKNPRTFLTEYAWPTDGCGQPCATEPLLIHELLSLGGDAFEEGLPKAERFPKPPDLTPEEKAAQDAELKALKPKERRQRKKQIEEERRTVAERKALLERHKYVLTRLHYRHDPATLPEDPKLGPAGGAVEGGVALPKGQKMEVSIDVKPASENRLQTRYNHFHPWKPVIQCEHPERGKWGKSPPDYRGLRKIWVAEDLARKNRKQIKPEKVVLTALPALGLGAAAATPAPSASAPTDAANASAASSSDCGCRVAGGTPGERNAGTVGLLGAALGALAALRRRRR
ncbi:MAG TPA: DUF2330 domain-containing protein [Polyangiaceae bacterium]|nr:DUF2330 domain-containing protein [Polyangiaceae bacterium]